MFKVKIFTLYPEFFPGPFNKGIYGKAIDKKIWDMNIINIRDYSGYKCYIGNVFRETGKSEATTEPHSV